MKARLSPWGTELLRPLPLAAALLLVVNDHVLKGSGLLPSQITGKLSDVAGLFVFPIFLFVAVDGASGRCAGRPACRRFTAISVCGVTAFLFAAIKLAPSVNAVACALFGPMLLDATDLIALPATLLAAAWLWRTPTAMPRRPQPLRNAIAFSLIGAACLATSRPRLVRNYPAWELESLGARRLECAIVDLWVSKSGKQGFGVTLEITPLSSCSFGVASARFLAGDRVVSAARLAPVETLTSKRHLYMPFAFDNEALWNEGMHDGRLEIVIDVGTRRERLAFSMKHVWSGPHRDDRERHELPDAASRFAEPPP